MQNLFRDTKSLQSLKIGEKWRFKGTSTGLPSDNYIKWQNEDHPELGLFTAYQLQTNSPGIMSGTWRWVPTVSADNVIVSGKGDAEKERLLDNAKTYERFKDYNKANMIYRQITEDYPDDYRGWLGLVLLENENFTKIDLNREVYEKISFSWKEY